VWEKIKAWSVKTALPWLKKGWMHLMNILVMLITYMQLHKDGTIQGLEIFVGAWLFVLLVYYVFWKLLGAERIIKKKPTNT